MKNKGFTILEILVVISVIAILIAIAIPRFKGMQDEANIIRVKAELKTIQAAMESYRNNNSTYAEDLATLEGATPRIIESGMNSPLTLESYGIDLSDNDLYYVIYGSTATGGSASISDSGVVASTNALCVTNGTGC